ncbi:ABC transporter ATP-binding protein [Carboxydocella sp. ULO1]|uniref:ABC transporter ATP-binding protein n=1 Tax=Carboxydocella sp. ULO1 TaxID=1926599 RepID=UPI0009CF8AB6|nr:ABC transporter ATP-binding protein [Carboxydocella sp. ULO1]GAW27896.1 macrolide ABC transporter ATP-binding protein [Carboxydocella sp. ULO1]
MSNQTENHQDYPGQNLISNHVKDTKKNLIKPIIKVERLTQKFTMGQEEIYAVNDICLEINPGEFIALVGPSGSGKSTLLNLLGGLIRPTSGKVTIGDREITQLSEDALALLRRKHIGFVFQSFNLIHTLTALENVERPMLFAGVPKNKRHLKAKRLLELTGLSNRENHKPNELSGGQQQRVSIARALANDPEILLADEPTGNLDSKTSQEIIQLLNRLNRENQKTIVLVTHDPNIAAYGDRVIHFRDGRIEKIAYGSKSRRFQDGVRE